MPLFEVETENHIVITWAEDSDAASAVVGDAYPQEHVMRLPVSYFDSTQSGVLISRIMTDAEGGGPHPMKSRGTEKRLPTSDFSSLCFLSLAVDL
jgi:hypothetical protein